MLVKVKCYWLKGSMGVMMISTNGGMGEEVAHRVLEGTKVWETMVKLWEENR